MSEKAQRRAAERYEDNEEKLISQAIQHLMKSYPCRMFIYHLLDEFGTEGTPFDPIGDSQTNFNAGMQNAGLIIRNRIVAETPDAYIRMLQERKALDDRTAERDAERDSRRYDTGLSDGDTLPDDDGR